MIRRSASIALRAAAVAAAALLLIAAIFVWQAMNGPVSLGPLTSRLEAMINAGLKDFQLRFSDSAIEWSEGKKLAFLDFVTVEAVDRNGTVIARVPRASVSLSGPALLNGEIAPTRVELSGAAALVVRRADGAIQLGFHVVQNGEDKGADKTSESMTKAILQAMLTPTPDDSLSRYLQRFAVTDAKLTIFDEQSRSYWIAEKASLTFDRKDNGVVTSVSAPIRLSDNSIWLFTGAGIYTNGSDSIKLEASFKPVRLSLLARSGAGLQALRGVNVPVSGNASCALSLEGILGRCTFWLNAGAGALTLPALKKEPIRLKRAGLTLELDFATQRYAVEELSWSGERLSGVINGSGAFAFAADGAIASLTADWVAENVSIDAPDLFEGGLALETAKFRGAFDASRGQLAIEEFLARRGVFSLNLSGALQDHSVSTGVVLNGGFKDLSIADLKRLWPAGIAQGARGWIIENVHEGTIRSGTVAINVAPGAVVDNRIPDEMMNIALSMDGLRLTYLNGLPDLAGVKGTATLLGDTFKAEITGGGIGPVALKQGSFTIAELHRHGTPGSISGALSGPTGEILAIVDRPRLGYPTRYGISAAQAGGQADVNFAFVIPMLKDLNAEDVGINIDAELKDVKLPINDQLRITGGTFLLKLDTQKMKAHGAVLINGARMGFNWAEDFTGAATTPTRIDVTATLNEDDRNRLGLDITPYVEGKTTTIAVFTGRGGKILNARVDANLTSARLSAPELSWAKPADATASLKADIIFRPDRTIEIANLDASGQGLKAQGRLVIGDGRVRQAEFKRLQLGPRNDFALTYSSLGDRGTSVEAKGRVVDVGGFFAGDDDADKGKPVKERRAPLSIKADLGLAYLKGDVWFTGMKLIYADDGDRLTAFSVDASADASNVRGELTREGAVRKLKMQTADAGRLVRALTGFRSLIGGQLSLAVDLSALPPPGQITRTEPNFDGVLRIEKFKIVNQPFVARLLSAGSFTGLDDLLRGEGITFTRLEQSFQGRGDTLTLIDGRAAGPAIGLTAQGVINRQTDRIDLNGTVVPLYGLNSMFEGIPLLGDILTSREGEGIFGVTYGVRGEVDDLRIAVNPISMLAPGFLRKIFQMGPTPQAATPMQPARKPEAQNAFQPAAPKTN